MAVTKRYFTVSLGTTGLVVEASNATLTLAEANAGEVVADNPDKIAFVVEGYKEIPET